ncbi:MAG: dephospho-CoA kinase [Firmicutes bacterium]|nr:dephospho-CoA kinase [Bacillota bacterium]
MVVGLTGSIATGKSVVARILAELGAKIIDADRVAREVVQPGEPALAEIVAAFGRKVLQPEGELNRKALAELVFTDAASLARLNQITHPRIIERINELCQAYLTQGAGLVVIDAPLLIETGLAEQVDVVVVTTCPREVQIARIQARDGLSRAEAEQRIASQLPQEEKIKQADFVIETDCSLAELRVRVKEVWEEIVHAQDSGTNRS